jgi:hypothetical protein
MGTSYLLAVRRVTMNLETRKEPWTDPKFLENQRGFPAAELLRYAGQHIAWSWDGSRILAGDPDRATLDRKLREAGIDSVRVVHDFVEDPEQSYLA